MNYHSFCPSLMLCNKATVKSFWGCIVNREETWQEFFKKQTVQRCMSASRAPRPAFSGGPARARTKSIQSLRQRHPFAFTIRVAPMGGGGTEIFMSGAFTHTPMRLPSLWYTARWTQRWSLPVHLLLIFGPGPDPWKCSCELYRTSLMQAADTTHCWLPIMLICYSWSTWPHILQSAFNSGTGPRHSNAFIVSFKQPGLYLDRCSDSSGVGVPYTYSDSLTLPRYWPQNCWKMDAV